MNATLETTCTHKPMLSLKWEGDCGCSQAKIPNVVFWGRKNTGSTFWYRFWATTGNFFISKNLVYCLMSVLHFSSVVHQYSSWSIAFPSPELWWYAWDCLTFGIYINYALCHIFIANKWEFSNHLSYWLPYWENKI